MGRVVSYNEDVPRCTFCGKTEHQVRKLVAGPSAAICDECIELCVDIVSEERQHSADVNALTLPKPAEISAYLDPVRHRAERGETHAVGRRLQPLQARQHGTARIGRAVRRNRRYILMTASGGAVALIRLSDHKLMFYANCGQNPHSAEVLPDGNIVTAESKSGEINTFVVDTVKVLGAKANTVKLGNAHNVVWDKKRSYLYATATKKEGVTALFRFSTMTTGVIPS